MPVKGPTIGLVLGFLVIHCSAQPDLYDYNYDRDYFEAPGRCNVRNLIGLTFLCFSSMDFSKIRLPMKTAEEALKFKNIGTSVKFVPL